VSRWLKITLGVVSGLIVLLLINALVVSNETKGAYLRDDGAQLIDTSAGTLQVLDQGDPQGTPIVLLHCATCSMDWWGHLAPLLEQDHRVIRVDLLGMGGSDKPGSGYSIDNQASAVAEALAKLHVVGATVVGHSLGGSVAVGLVEQSPQLATRIVIIDQSAEDGFEHESLGERLSGWPVIGQALARLVQVAPTSSVRSEYDQAFAPGYNIASGFDNPDQPVDDLRTMTYTSVRGTIDGEEDFVDESPLDDRLRTLGVPVMVIFGAEDQIYDAPDAIARYRENVPGVQTHLIPGAGHSPNVEKPDLVAPLILSFAKPPPAPKEPTPKNKATPKKAASKKPAAGNKTAPAGKKPAQK
jgi:pimeloyl-ACP methyl ester carboxylesterase